MNRRKALKNIFVFSILTTVSYGGLKFYNSKRWISRSLLNEYKNLIAELAEVIIPTTDTPGAKTANVQDFIIEVLLNCTAIEDQNNFITGLNNLEKYCLSNFEINFLQCNLTQKLETLNYLEKKEIFQFNILNKVNKRLFGQPFIVQLKSLTVRAYCMSYEGATKGLAYEYIPTKYQPCVDLMPNQRSWATK